MITNKVHNKPKISVITPSFNQGAFLERTILSVIKQSYSNVEYIIIDGGSTDNSVSIIKKYENKLSYWTSEKDNGQSDAINKGFNMASGDILCWLNSDDFFMPDALLKIANFNWNDNVGAVSGIGHIIDVNDKLVYTPKFYEPITTQDLYQWTEGRDFMQPSCFFSREAWEKCGPLNVNLFFCMDVDFWIKISKSYKILRIEELLSKAYAHPLAKTTAEEDKMRLETFLMIATHGGFPQARSDLFRFFDKALNRKVITSDKVVTHFSTLKIIKILIKKIKSNLGL